MAETTAAASAAPTQGTGENIPAELLKLLRWPGKGGKEGAPVKREEVLSWRDHGPFVAAVVEDKRTSTKVRADKPAKG